MKKFKRTIYLALAGIMTTVCLAGCGSDGTADTVSASSDALTIEAIKAKGTLSVATEAAYEPFEYLEGDTIVGYNADLFHLIAEDLGVELDYQDLPFQGILAGLTAKKYDMVGATLGVTAERASQYTMTIPIERGTTTFLKRKGDDSINSAEDIAGKIVGTQTACYNETDITEYSDELISQGKESYAELKTYDSFAEAYMELKNGQVDVVAQNYASNAAMALNNPDIYELVKAEDGTPVTVGDETWLSWAVRKEDTELSDYINSEIKKFKEDGTMAQLQEKWFGDVCVDVLPESDFVSE